MKIISIIIFTWLLAICSPEKNNFHGVYELKTNRFYENIKLMPNNEFSYKYNVHFINYTLEGNYFVKGDSLILNSNPHRDKVIVRETKMGRKNITTFKVTDKQGIPFNYTLYCVARNNDTIVLKNQNNNSKVKDKEIIEFYIVDTKGLKTPSYIIKGERTNCFGIQMETKRSFDNEVWQIKDNTVLPRGMDSEYQDYVLNRVKGH